MLKISKIPKRLSIFLKEVLFELKRVNWLTRQEVFRYTIIVIAFSLAVAAFLGGLDFLFTSLMKKFIFR